MNTFDLLIVGAGPAGSFAAEKVASGGTVRVALFDGRPSGEPKACGGGVTSKALKAWPHLREAAGHVVDEVEMYAPSGRSVRLKLDEPFAIYSRRALDSHLRERARAAGAGVFAERVTLLPNKPGEEFWTLRGATTKSEWRGRYLVAADGANSAIARSLSGPLPNSEMEMAFGYRAPLPKSDDVATTVIAFLPNWAGYAWAFPRIDHVSFGIATTQDSFDHQELDRLLWEFMTGYYERSRGARAPLWSKDRREIISKEKIAGSTERYAARIPGLSAEMWGKRRTCGENWALLGDAAGFADPVTGEGIYYALRSAEIFAAAYAKGDARDYEKLWRADFGNQLIKAAKMRGRFYGSFFGANFTERMIELARLHPGVRRTLRELVAGDQGYVGLKGVLAKRAVWPL